MVPLLLETTTPIAACILGTGVRDIEHTICCAENKAVKEDRQR